MEGWWTRMDDKRPSRMEERARPELPFSLWLIAFVCSLAAAADAAYSFAINSGGAKQRLEDALSFLFAALVGVVATRARIPDRKRTTRQALAVAAKIVLAGLCLALVMQAVVRLT